MKIGDRIYVRGYIDEIRKDTVIVRNDGGYFGTIPSEVITGKFPSAQPERKTGKWIKHSIGHEHTPWGFDCSECGEWLVVGEEVIKKYNYCPNCGADMRD